MGVGLGPRGYVAQDYEHSPLCRNYHGYLFRLSTIQDASKMDDYRSSYTMQLLSPQVRPWSGGTIYGYFVQGGHARSEYLYAWIHMVYDPESQ
jgi:hypothetical protein